MKNTRAFYSVLSPPNFKALEFLSPITWEDVWLRQQMSNTKVSRDEVKEAIWKWAHRGRNYILHLAIFFFSFSVIGSCGMELKIALWPL